MGTDAPTVDPRLGRAGSSTLEAVGMICAAALMVVALLAAAPGWGQGLSGRIDCAVRAIAGGDDGACPDAERPAQAAATTGPTQVTRSDDDSEAETFAASGAGGITPAIVGGDDGRCTSLANEGGEGEVCLAAEGPGVAICGRAATCSTSGVPIGEGGLLCGDDPQVADPLVMLCGFRTDDGKTGALLRCRVDVPVAPTDVEGCDNTNRQPPGPTPTDCFGTPHTSSRSGKRGTEISVVSLCADAAGAVSVCTATTIDSFPWRTDPVRACSGSIPPYVDGWLGLDCGPITEQAPDVECRVGGRTIACLGLLDPDGHPTYHHCQDRRRPPAVATPEPGTCLLGTTTQAQSCSSAPPAADPERPGTTELGERCPPASRRGLQMDPREAAQMVNVAFCAALAQQLGSILLQGVGLMAWIGPGGVVEQTAIPGQSPHPALLQASNVAHQAVASDHGAFSSPLLVVTTPGATLPGPGSVLVVNPDGSLTTGLGPSHGASEPLTLPAGQHVAFFAGGPGAPGLLLAAPDATSAELEFGHALAWVHQAFPGLNTSQQTFLAIIAVPSGSLSSDSQVALGDRRLSELAFRYRRTRQYDQRSRRLRIIREQLADGAPFETIVADIQRRVS